MCDNHSMKLSEYARRNGILYRSAWERFRLGKIPGAYLDDSGHIVIPEPEHLKVGVAVVYARVSTHKQKDDLDRQAARMVTFANESGLQVIAVVTEVGSGVNDNRKKLTKLLKRDDWGTLVVEHKDRLSRVGFGWFDVLLSGQGRRVLVANLAQEETSDLMQDFVSIIYSFAARLYGLRSAKQRTKAAIKAIEKVVDAPQ